MPFNDVIADEILWVRRKLNALAMTANRSPDGITCKGSRGQQIGHPALRGFTLINVHISTWYMSSQENSYTETRRNILTSYHKDFST